MTGVPPLETLTVFIYGPLPGPVETVYGDNTTSSLPRPGSARLSLHSYDIVKMEYPPKDRIGEYGGIILTGAGACLRGTVLR